MSAKRHHYALPEFHLALFTPNGTPDDQLVVLQVPSGRRLRLRPKDVGVEGHFYTVPDVDDPFFFETALSEFEAKAAPVVRSLSQTHEMPSTTEGRTILMNYFALLASRGPFARQRLAQMTDVVDHLVLRAAAASRERIRDVMTVRGGRAPDDAEVDGYIEMIRRRAFTIERHPSEHVRNATQMHDAILQSIALRSWMVFVRTCPPYFVTSDNPVVLAWGELPAGVALPPPPFDGPGYGTRHTEITFPVSSHVALVGTFEAAPAPAMPNASVEIVACINSRTITSAMRFIAAPSDDVVLFDRELQLVGIEAIPEILKDIAERRSKRREAELAQMDRIIPL